MDLGFGVLGFRVYGFRVLGFRKHSENPKPYSPPLSGYSMGYMGMLLEYTQSDILYLLKGGLYTLEGLHLKSMELDV